MDWNFATLWESVADALPDRVAIVQGEQRADVDASSTTAPPASPQALTAAGLEPGAKVASYLYNGNEYLEGSVRHVQDARRRRST